jgi:hypothetical protein
MLHGHEFGNPTLDYARELHAALREPLSKLGKDQGVVRCRRVNPENLSP